MPPGRILVVDDEKDIVEIISRYLLKEGFAVQRFTDSRVAAESVRTNPFAFDLLLTDFDMPFVSGQHCAGPCMKCARICLCSW